LGYQAVVGTTGIISGISGKKLLACTTAVGFLIGAGIWGSEKPTITFHYSDSDYTNRGIEVSVAVDSKAPIKSILVTSEVKVLPITTGDKGGEYTVR
ncbi:hypothetical protein, partial [Enterocloster bolteae]|uniref:hypothetical protein n=1 Tax=Enterocloster bolteae TaxID=208479 RepID=UPI00210908BE